MRASRPSRSTSTPTPASEASCACTQLVREIRTSGPLRARILEHLRVSNGPRRYGCAGLVAVLHIHSRATVHRTISRVLAGGRQKLDKCLPNLSARRYWDTPLTIVNLLSSISPPRACMHITSPCRLERSLEMQSPGEGMQEHAPVI